MLLRAFVVLGCILSAMILVANDATFIALYDSEKHDEAAKALENADLKNHEVARRAGAMYYRGLGVVQNKERGKAYIEAAMAAGDAKAAINLAKIWYRAEHNAAKAAWCLLVAENAKDESIQADVAKLHERFGSEYKTGLEQYIRQQDAALKDAVNSLKEMTEENTSLRQQLLEANQTQKKLRDQIRAFKEEIALVKRKLKEFEDKAERKEEALKTLEEKCRLAEKRTNCLIDTTNELQRVLGSRILALEDQLSAATFSLEQSRMELINVENELSSATNRLSELDRELPVLEIERQQERKQHDELQREHAELLIAYEQLKERGKSGGDRSSFKGVGRGFATLVMAPCNYLRVVPQTCEMADEIESKNGCPQLSVIMAFPLLVWDTIPTIADIADGVVDIVSLGDYGDWLYSEEGSKGNSPWWYERSNKGLPWIQK